MQNTNAVSTTPLQNKTRIIVGDALSILLIIIGIQFGGLGCTYKPEHIRATLPKTGGTTLGVVGNDSANAYIESINVECIPVTVPSDKKGIFKNKSNK